MTLTADQQDRLAKIMEIPVHRGKGSNGAEDACVMQMTDWVYRNANHWTDQPTCVSPVITKFMIAWNDAANDEDRQRLKPYIGKVIGTRTTEADERIRSYMALDWYCRVSTPAWLRLIGKTAEADAIAACAPIVDPATARAATEALQRGAEVARDAGAAVRATARAAARAAAWAAVWAAAGDAAWAAAWDAAGDAAGADAVRAAARAAAWAAVWAAAGDAAWAAAWDAAGDALAPTVLALQTSSFELLDRMIAVGRK